MGVLVQATNEWPHWTEKRRYARSDVVGVVNADFIAPSELTMFDISRGGVGLCGVGRIAVRNVGLVQFRSARDRPWSASTCKICWSDGQGRVGLKFVELHALSPEWQPWFDVSSDQITDEPNEAGDPALTAAMVCNAFLEPPDPALVTATVASGEGNVLVTDGAESPAWDRDQPPDNGDIQLQQSSAPSQHPKAQRNLQWRRLLWLCGALFVVAVVTIILYSQWSAVKPMLRRVAEMVQPSSFSAGLAHPSYPSLNSRIAIPVRIIEGQPVLPPELQLYAPGQRISRGTPVSRDSSMYLDTVPSRGHGNVRLLLRINSKGLVEDVHVVRGDPLIASATVAAAAHWRYTPFRIESRPVAVNLPVTVILQIPVSASR
jgi:hypothetical protein